MKNIHLLATDKPSRLHQYGSYSSLGLSKEYLHWKLAKNIYISSEEEMKEGWYINKSTNEIVKRSGFDENWKYIMLTTDQDLIKDSVQAINDEFLEWFVKNPTCENIYVEEFNYYNIDDWDYIITIPKEKPKEELLQLERKEFDDFAAAYAINKAKEDAKKLKEKELLEESNNKAKEILSEIKSLPKQETLEEAAEKYAEGKDSSSIFKAVHKKDFINGGKWQQEEIGKSEFLQKLRATSSDVQARILIFETFKNK
jgi:hypothetical protein